MSSRNDAVWTLSFLTLRNLGENPMPNAGAMVGNFFYITRHISETIQDGHKLVKRAIQEA